MKHLENAIFTDFREVKGHFAKKGITNFSCIFLTRTLTPYFYIFSMLSILYNNLNFSNYFDLKNKVLSRPLGL